MERMSCWYRAHVSSSSHRATATGARRPAAAAAIAGGAGSGATPAWERVGGGGLSHVTQAECMYRAVLWGSRSGPGLMLCGSGLIQGLVQGSCFEVQGSCFALPSCPLTHPHVWICYSPPPPHHHPSPHTPTPGVAPSAPALPYFLCSAAMVGVSTITASGVDEARLSREGRGAPLTLDPEGRYSLPPTRLGCGCRCCWGSEASPPPPPAASCLCVRPWHRHRRLPRLQSWSASSGAPAPVLGGACRWRGVSSQAQGGRAGAE